MKIGIIIFFSISIFLSILAIAVSLWMLKKQLSHNEKMLNKQLKHNEELLEVNILKTLILEFTNNNELNTLELANKDKTNRDIREYLENKILQKTEIFSNLYTRLKTKQKKEKKENIWKDEKQLKTQEAEKKQLEKEWKKNKKAV